MAGSRWVLAIAFLGSLLLSPLGAQESSGAHPEWGLDLTIGGSGLAIGNIPRVNGVRINFRDYRLDEVNGLNLTLWPPQGDRRVGGIVRGLALGLTAPTADRIQGISLGGLAVVTHEELSGISFGGLAVVGEGAVRGISIGGLATVSNGNSSGINLGGLATVAEGYSRGLNFGGLATVSNGGSTGVNFGGLAVVAGKGSATGLQVGGLAVVAGGGSLTGVSLGGLAVVAADGVARGLNVGGLAVVGVGGVEGLSFGGLAVVSEEHVRGISLGGYKVDAPVGSWVAGALWKVEVDDFEGLSLAAWNEHDTRARGLSIGLLNRTEELSGVQIGLLNYAGNNARFRWLPIINAHF